MMLQQLAMLVLSVLCIGSYVCRVGQLDLRHDRLSVCLLHLALLWASIRCAWQAVDGPPSAADWILLAIATGWIAHSYTHWRHGVPARVKRVPWPEQVPSWFHSDPLDR